MITIDRYLESCRATAPKTDSDARELREVIHQKSFQKTIRVLLEEMEGHIATMTLIDLSVQDNISVAVRAQGQIAGMRRLLDLLFERLEIEEIEEDADTETGS